MNPSSNIIKVACITPHFGEEPVLTGTRGVGAVFLSGCNLRCVFCQNWQISQENVGEMLMTPGQLAEEMLRLQEMGCHAIDIVSPSHQVRELIRSIRIAKGQNLTIPVVYNTNSMDTLEALRSLEGLIDIYLPDLKYSDAHIAGDLSRAPRYVSRARAAIKEMYRQAGHLFPDDENSIAESGLIIRLLVLPGDYAGCADSLRWIAEEVGPETWLSIMAQYNPKPLFNAGNRDVLKKYPELARSITEEEYQRVLDQAQALGFENIFIQDRQSAVEYALPDFQSRQPFEWKDRSDDDDDSSADELDFS